MKGRCTNLADHKRGLGALPLDLISTQAPHLTDSHWLQHCAASCCAVLCNAAPQGLSEYRTVSGVGGGDPPPPSSNSSSGSRRRSGSGSNDSSSQRAGPSGSHSSGVGCQAGKLPELVIRGQAGSDPSTQGSLQLKGVRALFNRAGGLDISLYSAGMVCADLLSRMQVRWGVGLGGPWRVVCVRRAGRSVLL